MTKFTFTSGATITFRGGPSEPIISSPGAIHFDSDGYIVEVPSGTEWSVALATTQRNATPENWEPEE